MKRPHFEPEHEEFRRSVRAFARERLAPHHLEWEEQRIVPRSVFTDAGRGGFIGTAVPLEYGGGGVRDFRFNQILSEELFDAGLGGSGLGLTLHNDVTMPYFIKYSSDEQKARWLPGIASGKLITAIAMTEPGAGSDLAGMSTTARRDVSEYIVNGSKTFITNGINADLVIVATVTDPDAGRSGMTLLVVERGMQGFDRGRKLDKIGLHAQDTAELFFNDVRVPASNRLGEEGAAFGYLTSSLAQERLSIAVAGVASARAALRLTVEYVTTRRAFGKRIADFQNTKFVLAEVKTEIDVAQAYLDQCVVALNSGELTGDEAAAAKWWCTELQRRATDRCLQLFGGYGYMMEYPIARAYLDARVTTIYGGTTEIMKTIISKSMGL
ncbi:acyl-CoA dehydrogenase family protein [Microtetraspora sp. NBRC 16547]|uniref:acyl-CoA dehydrogenase family protein n=1 Tax=Microtetraspora sp. NBRC 16547 TaxID=3030993 RepID=UPI0024A0363A|nr:acyl-CoA dehydrogenase family protein [Microtetraspora sp. NBRC 16547]GLW99318.1 putative acyl-CoA dehydrogenase [Microtetraspora sp. NBRC 16547]